MGEYVRATTTTYVLPLCSDDSASGRPLRSTHGVPFAAVADAAVITGSDPDQHANASVKLDTLPPPSWSTLPLASRTTSWFSPNTVLPPLSAATTPPALTNTSAVTALDKPSVLTTLPCST